MQRLRLGQGFLELSQVAGRTAVTRAQASNPLKLLMPRRTGQSAWIYTSTFGGGLLDGDRIDLTVRVRPGAWCVLGTQSSTKVYRNQSGRATEQSLHATVARDAMLVLVPDPVTCYADSIYDQKQRFELQDGGTLVLIDWLTSGRRARSESWAFSRFRSRNEIYLGKDHLFADVLLLDPQDGPMNGPYRLGRFHCLALVVIVGQSLEEESRALLERVDAQEVCPGSPLIDAASPIRQGAVLRVLGETTELVGSYLKERLGFLGELLGETPWERKW